VGDEVYTPVVLAPEIHSSSHVILSRLLWAGPLTILAAVAAVLCLRVVAVGILHPALRFAPLRWPPPIIDTVILVTGAVIVFSVVSMMSSNPIRTFRIVAASVLLLSFVPDVLLATRHYFGGGWPEALALMSMHVAAWFVTVTMPIGLTAVKTDPRRWVSACSSRSRTNAGAFRLGRLTIYSARSSNAAATEQA
jgi:hypothetical protein